METVTGAAAGAGTIAILVYAAAAEAGSPAPVGVCGYCAGQRGVVAVASRDRGDFLEEADVCAACLGRRGEAYLRREFFPQRWRGKGAAARDCPTSTGSGAPV
jgi:hypothetical protein